MGIVQCTGAVLAFLPSDLVQPHGVLEAAQGHVAAAGEEEALARRQLPDHVCRHDLAGLGVGADAGGQLDGGAE